MQLLNIMPLNNTVCEYVAASGVRFLKLPCFTNDANEVL
jgi:hypothetical protein